MKFNFECHIAHAAPGSVDLLDSSDICVDDCRICKERTAKELIDRDSG